MSAHKEYHPEQVRSRLSHPVIDGDGHWIEYGPVFAEQVRKAAGDKAGDGLLRHMRRIVDTLIGKAIDGDLSTIREIFDRIDGKAPPAAAGAAPEEPQKVVFQWKSDQ